MFRHNTICTTALIALALSACSDSSDPVQQTTAIDLTGNWVSQCEVADTSNAPSIGEAYYNDELAFSDTRINVTTAIFTDSDCITLLTADFARSDQFDDGTFSLGLPFTTETGLTAYPLEITTSDTQLAVQNITVLVNNTLYFGFDPLDGSSQDTRLPLRSVDLENGYKRR